jgi:hypothetical protein
MKRAMKVDLTLHEEAMKITCTVRGQKVGPRTIEYLNRPQDRKRVERVVVDFLYSVLAQLEGNDVIFRNSL